MVDDDDVPLRDELLVPAADLDVEATGGGEADPDGVDATEMDCIALGVIVAGEMPSSSRLWRSATWCRGSRKPGCCCTRC